jgi:hypothetical protein
MRDVQRLVDGHRPAAETVGECFAFDHLHDEKMAPRRFLEAVERGDVGMIQRCEDLGLSLESREAVLVERPRLRQQLDGNRAP